MKTDMMKQKTAELEKAKRGEAAGPGPLGASCFCRRPGPRLLPFHGKGDRVPGPQRNLAKLTRS